VNARLVALAAILGRRYGRVAAEALLRSGREWLADPANEATKQAYVEQLRTWAQRAGGLAGRMSARLAREVERRRVSVGAWERDLMALRYEIADMAPGPMREAAIGAYTTQARAGVHLVGDASRPDDARRQVLAALRAEASMLARERLSADERRRALDAVAEARAALDEDAPVHAASGSAR
jgi:hypothetical protein